ncbi:MAG: ABC transporter permease subunit, partial [Clostridiales bacterium]|nr:ABC transporter permease subunit [Candidatus Apopatocola equi]
ARVFLSFAHVLSGAVLIESVFAYPGIGLLLREAALNRDYPLLQGLYVIIAFLVLTMNALADVLYRRIDRRLSRE